MVEKKQKVDLNQGFNPRDFFMPTKVTTYAFCFILLAVFFLGLFNSFSFSYMNFGSDIEGMGSFFEIGYPWTFISLSMTDENPFQFNFLVFLLSVLLYFLISYIADLAIVNSFKAMKNNIEEVNSTTLEEEELKEEIEEKEKS